MKTPSYEEMQGLFRAHTEAAVKVIVEIMNGSGGKGDAVRLSAAKEVLTRGWGKPAGQEKKQKLPPAKDPAYQGKALTQIAAEEAEAAGVPPPWGDAVPGETKPGAPLSSEPATASPAAASAPRVPPVPALPPAVTAAAAARADDPTGYKARRALWSGPPPAGKS